MLDGFVSQSQETQARRVCTQFLVILSWQIFHLCGKEEKKRKRKCRFRLKGVAEERSRIGNRKNKWWKILQNQTRRIPQKIFFPFFFISFFFVSSLLDLEKKRTFQKGEIPEGRNLCLDRVVLGFNDIVTVPSNFCVLDKKKESAYQDGGAYFAEYGKHL